MRQAYIVTYDVCDPKRLRKVFKVLSGYGDHLQLSVFRCELSARELLEMRVKLSRAIHHDHDQILFVDIGPIDGRGAGSITALGVSYVPPERRVVVL